MVEALWLCGLNGLRFWVRNERCGCPGIASMPWTLWCYKRRRKPQPDVTWAVLSGLIPWFFPPHCPPSSAPTLQRDTSSLRARCHIQHHHHHHFSFHSYSHRSFHSSAGFLFAFYILYYSPSLLLAGLLLLIFVFTLELLLTHSCPHTFSQSWLLSAAHN